jgi:hypothetical protein
MTTRHTITARFASGEEVARTTSAPYMFASRRVTGTQAGRGATVRFHTNEDAARDAAGARGEVVRTDYAADAPAGSCVVCRGERFVEYGPSAIDGTMDRVPCHRCNADASITR